MSMEITEKFQDLFKILDSILQYNHAVRREVKEVKHKLENFHALLLVNEALNLQQTIKEKELEEHKP